MAVALRHPHLRSGRDQEDLLRRHRRRHSRRARRDLHGAVIRHPSPARSSRPERLRPHRQRRLYDYLPGTEAADVFHLQEVGWIWTASACQPSTSTTASGGRDVLDAGGVGLRQVEIATRADGSLSVTHGEAMAVLRGVEFATFADGRLVMDENDPAARVVRLYEAALDRVPDQGGLNFWIDAIQHGQSLTALAQGFIASSEFESRFGGASASNGAFVDQLYLNVLGRAAEQGGATSGWARSTAAPRAAPRCSSASPRAPRTRRAPRRWCRPASGTAARPRRSGAPLRHRVRPLAGRSGLVAWKNVLEGGSASLVQVADSFTQSAEFRGEYGNLGNRDFANALYVNTLDVARTARGSTTGRASSTGRQPRRGGARLLRKRRARRPHRGQHPEREPGQYGILFA